MSLPVVGRATSQRVRARLDALQPADLPLRGARRYQRLRRSVLAVSWACVVGVPLLHAARVYDTIPPVIGAPTSLAVGPVEFVDPLAALGVVLTGGATAAVLIGVTLPLLAVLLLGRFFCGWICPYVPVLAVSNAARALLARFGLRPADAQLPRRSNIVALVVLLIGSLAAGSQLALLVYPPALIGREVWRLVYFGGLGGGAGIIATCFVFDTLFARAGTCRYLCPGGALFTILGRWSPLRIVRERAKCTDCSLCDIVCNMRQSPMTDAVDSGCDRCARCVSVCPTKALRVGTRGP